MPRAQEQAGGLDFWCVSSSLRPHQHIQHSTPFPTYTHVLGRSISSHSCNSLVIEATLRS